MNIKFKPLAISILIALGVGGLSGYHTMGNMDIYGNINKPPLSPPPIVFPIVWTILFILMGISAYLIYESNSNLKGKALAIYGLQLVVNFFWPIIFFNGQKFLLAFVWLLLLVALIIETLLIFKDINKKASLLLIPYLLWSIFATYLNLGVYLLNR